MKEKIAKIQKEMGTLKRDTKAYNYNYATLNQIQEKLNPLLEKEGLMLTQPIDGDRLYTHIQEIKGDGITSCSIILPTGVKPQDMGSAITYYRRYLIVSLLNLEVEDDDDGKRASTVIESNNDKKQKDDDLEF